MDYILAKALKEAGFPQNPHKFSIFGNGTIGGVDLPYFTTNDLRDYRKAELDLGEIIIIPTLE